MEQFKANPDLIEGTTVTLGGQSFVMPPLNFKALKKYLPAIGKFQSNKVTVEQMGLMTEVIQSALVRNYPDVTQDFIEENLDLRNMTGIFEAAMNQSGLEPQKGEEQPVTGTL